jgi:hypothetical protein
MTDSAGAASANPPTDAARTMDLVAQAARQGASDASEAAARVWSATGLAVSKILYNASYSVSYGVVFPVAFIAQAIPRDNAAVRGLIEGAEAASQKVDRLLGRSASI